MISLAALFTKLPLADRSHWESLGSKFSGDHLSMRTEDLYGLAGFVVAFGVLLVLLRWANHQQHNAAKRQARKALFRELCLAHGLTWRERQLLRRARKELGLELAEEFFVRPELFAANAATPGCVADPNEWVLLGKRLFVVEP